jgi:lipopolysaccharide/colanic/teichoic acid biosynthesis glycosyltransferase
MPPKMSREVRTAVDRLGGSEADQRPPWLVTMLGSRARTYAPPDTVRVTSLEPVGNVGERGARLLARVAKRALDVVGATLGLLLSIPIVAVAMLAIALESRGGPVLYHQTRVGRGGRPFEVHKLRTMRAGNDGEHAAYVASLIEGSALRHGELFKISDDPRCTRVGRFLRKTSIDELPQLWNVLRGDMSLVGPRPSTPEESALMDAVARHRQDVKPGMTGLWQVCGRSRLGYDDMIELDLRYVRTWSPLVDVWILVRTPFAVFRRETA